MTTGPQADRIKEGDHGAIVLTMAADLKDDGETAFNRADLIVDGVPHGGSSYEVRLFINNTAANAGTNRDARDGYAGSFAIFGHGDCLGGDGHCSLARAPQTDITVPAALATSRPHPLTPMRKVVTITDGLKAAIAGTGRVETITFVPIKITARRADRTPAAGLFSFSQAMLQTYR